MSETSKDMPRDEGRTLGVLEKGWARLSADLTSETLGGRVPPVRVSATNGPDAVSDDGDRPISRRTAVVTIAIDSTRGDILIRRLRNPVLRTMPLPASLGWAVI